MRLPALTALLKKLEWSGVSRYHDGGAHWDEIPCCPICHRHPPIAGHDDDEPSSHDNNCELAQAITELESLT